MVLLFRASYKNLSTTLNQCSLSLHTYSMRLPNERGCSACLCQQHFTRSDLNIERKIIGLDFKDLRNIFLQTTMSALERNR